MTAVSGEVLGRPWGASPSAGPSVGPSAGPSVGPSAGPSVGPSAGQACAPSCARLCTLEGFADAYERFTPALLARAHRLVGDPQQAEELVQETYLRAWRACASFQPGIGSLRGWLFTICRNLAIDASRTRAVRPLITAGCGNAELPAPEPVDPVDRLEQWLTQHHLAQALGRLSEPHREILVEAFIHDRPYRDIADQLGIPAGTVKSRVFHALRALRRELGGP